MMRVVSERFPNREKWPDLHIEVITYATFEERAWFIGDEGCMDYEFLFWAIQEAESSDPVQAARWARYRTANPSRLNIRPPRSEALANIPLEFLPAGVRPPRRRG